MEPVCGRGVGRGEVERGASRGAATDGPPEESVRGADTPPRWGPGALSVVLIRGPHPNTQTTAVAIEALTRFREAVPLEGVQDLHVQVSAPKRELNVEWFINPKNAYHQRSAKVRH